MNDLCYNKAYLKHHGIEGQHWGVRRGPPYPIEDKVLKKGTRLNSVSATLNSDDYKNSGKPMYVFNPDDKWDSAVYKGPFSKYLAAYRGASFVKEHEYELVKDLTMPTKKERIDEFKALPQKQLIQDLKKVRELLVTYGVGNAQERQDYRDIDLDHLETDKDYKVAYSIFNHAMEASWAYNSTKEYMKNMSNKYDAMVDDNNQGVYNSAHDPIVIFKANEVLKTISTEPVSNLVTPQEVDGNYEYVRKELVKKGERVKL